MVFYFKEHKISILCASVSAVVVVFQTSRFWYLADLSFILEHSYKLLHGFTLYKDFIFPYPPGTFYIQAIIIKLFGTTLYPQIIYCSLISFFTYLLTYRILFFFNKDKLLNILISLPVAFTGGYGIVSFPFYDPDSVFFILLSIFLIFYSFELNFPPLTAFLGGFFAVFPAFFKQNTGLVFILFIHAAILIVLLLKRDEINFKSYAIFISGSIISFAGWLFYIQITSGIGNYYYSIITIPRQVRLPTPTRFFSDYLNFNVIKDIILWIIVLLILYLKKSKGKVTEFFIFVIFLAPFYILPFMRYLFLKREYYDAFLYIWPVTMILSAVAGFYAILKLKEIKLFSRIFIFVLIALVNAAFLSQGYNSSTYSLWPLLSIFFGILYFILSKSRIGILASNLKMLFAVNSAAITISVAVLIISNFQWHMVFYLGGSGELHSSSTPSLRGLTAPGEFIPNLDNLVDFVKNEIPPGDGIETIPHEDPFFFATGRSPVLPYYINEWSQITYTPEEIAKKIVDCRIKWIIVKTKLQMGDSDLNRHVGDIISRLKKDFTLFKVLPGYEVYKLSQ